MDTGPTTATTALLLCLRTKDEGVFEEVRRDGSALQAQHRNAEAPKLTLGNKFDALRDE